MGRNKEGRILQVDNSPWPKNLLRIKRVSDFPLGSKQLYQTVSNKEFTTIQNHRSKITNFTPFAKKPDALIFMTVGQVEMLLS